ncbi:MAG: hypothetical protein ACI8PB_004684 [Desulforhopalus sp.]|jgi:hypothetical protein
MEKHMKSKARWVIVCVVFFVVALAITDIMHLTGIEKWSSSTVALFIGIGVLVIWEKFG